MTIGALHFFPTARQFSYTYAALTCRVAATFSFENFVHIYLTIQFTPQKTVVWLATTARKSVSKITTN